ncbi:M48 family metalloprotease [Pseudomonadales bacterium]|nr:M48 family metalloprotease [Pseudomonadales bacterium]MDC1368830.1 M48 family metalloprotease [Pseudomonadales bacterium]
MLRSADPQTATAAYIDSLGADALAQAAAYTLGNHWLLLVSLLVAGVNCWLFVRLDILGRLNHLLAPRMRALRVFLVCGTYFLVTSIVTMPLAIYAGWWREADYNRTSQLFGDFLSQTLLGTAISAVLGGLFFLLLYELMRRVGQRWWVWSGVMTALALSILLLISPILIEPLFNQYQPVPAGQVQDELRKLATRAQIPVDRIFTYDGSRQSNNFTANVSGVGSSARIAISDVALSSATLDEVKAVTAHEVGHFVLGHIWYIVGLYALLAIMFFFISARSFGLFARLFGLQAPLESAVGLPVLMFIISLLGFLGEPVINSLIRTNELAADRYSLEAVGLPDAMAGALVKTAEYRDPRPHPLQEFLFYTHPSVERRVLMAMQWKAEHGG